MESDDDFRYRYIDENDGCEGNLEHDNTDKQY